MILFILTPAPIAIGIPGGIFYQGLLGPYEGWR
jgi:hypothetical protein